VDDFRQIISYDELTSEGTTTLARIAAEAIRGLNRATNCDAGLDQPPVACDILSSLAAAASRLPQALTQITSYLTRAAAAGQLGHDLGQDPATCVEAAAIFPGDAAASAAALAGDLDAAQQQIAAASGRPAPRQKDTQ